MVDKQNNSDKKVSIVINTLNRENLLKDTLESFRYLDYSDFEVVVVNGPSTDGTDELLELWAGKIKIAKCPEANLSMSRNIGIAMASGDYVAFIDDDAIPEAEWLDQAIDGFDSDEVAATGGKVFDHTGYDYQYQFANATRLGHGKWQLTAPSPHYCFPGAYEFPYLQGTNTIFKRAALLEIGGFDEEFVYYLDETEVCLRLVDAGYLVKQLNNAYVHHKYAPSHIRTKTAAIYRYPVLKSKIYFANRYGRPYHSQAEIDADDRTFLQNHRNDVVHCLQTGRLSAADLSKFEEHAAQAWTAGKEAAQKSPARIATQLLKTHASEFKKFETIRPDSEQLTIVLLCEDYPPNLLGGIARYTQDKARALARLGHKVHVIARSHTHNTVDFENGVWVHRITAAHQPLSTEAESLNVPQSHWDQSKSFLDEIDRISTHRPIHVVEAPIWNIVGIATLLSGRYRLVTSLMTTLKLSLPSRPDLTEDKRTFSTFVEPITNIEKYLVKKSHGILAISRAIANEVEAAYGTKIGPQRLHVSHLGMPDWANNSMLLNNSSQRPLSILFVGRLEKRKGIDILLEAIPSLLEKFQHIEFDIVGDDSIKVVNGRTYREIFEDGRSNIDASRVRFHGKVPDSELKNFYSQCDIFVAPSRFESFGLIYLEAMMFAKPVVACHVGGIPEVVEDGETGILVSPDQSNCLENALIRLIESPSLRTNLGEKGRERYQALFTDVRMAKSCVDVFIRILWGSENACRKTAFCDKI